MKALFADLPEQTRTWHEHRRAYSGNERRQVLALCDAIQVAIAKGQHDRVSTLLREMHAIVGPALARLNGVKLRVSA